ncbi:Signal transduction histidine kinase [Singulisphaera sp. GP187]|uniref:sensor histidine kinase n=1 Tax=Singulisphaera sp. GP187 TaxID=1882752 RepID=UPI0009278345|nr:ATP-binding protein [Singulisphaera sp. GP187]SIO59148.1 Signal transduction histidine kinase [Singulisphaera sp. GP187]
MPQWPIRVKLIAGLTLVVGMMLTLMGGSIFGLHAFHASNLKLVDQLHELGASKELLQVVVPLESMGDIDTPAERLELETKVHKAQKALLDYHTWLRKNTTQGNRADDGRDELGLAFLIDSDLTAILNELNQGPPIEPSLPGTTTYLARHPEAQPIAVAGSQDPLRLSQTIARLNHRVMELPDILHRDFYAVLTMSKNQYQTSRVIVWTSALTVMGMLCGLSALFHRWVLYPVRLLQRGVRRVARGGFDYKIDLKTGDEMQALAEAFNDMTARLSVTYADLERQVHERSRQLVRSEQLAGVGFLAAGVAHEINNPLASIAFCSEALENRLGPMLDAHEGADAKVVRNYLRMIQEEAFRCKNITEKLLDFARCAEIQRERTDMAGLIQGVVEMIRHMGKYRGKRIVFQPREAVMAHVDSQEIKQVVLNLVVNALDSMEPEGTLRIEMRHAEGMAELVFADDGCGMSPEVLENIFEPFFTKRKVGKGTGLGLSITHRIVSQHQGEIMATSPGEGAGATFMVRLPIRPADDTPPESAMASKNHRAA